jgi:hypothetical protein
VRLVRTQRVWVDVLVLELLLFFTLRFRRLPGVLGHRRWVAIDRLIHARPPRCVYKCFQSGSPESHAPKHGRTWMATACGGINHPASTKQSRLTIQIRCPPLVIGGDGEKKTLRMVAQYADGWNSTVDDAAELKRKIKVLQQHCDATGRDPGEIRKTLGLGHKTDPFSDADAFRRTMESYAELGIEVVNIGVFRATRTESDSLPVPAMR